MKIAVVDDEQFIVEGLIKMIGRQYPEEELTGFTDPQEALASLSKDLPDLLITDIRMPSLTGLELIAALKKQGVLHYAVLTGLDDVPILQESIRLHVDDYLIKPVSKQELFSMIDSVRKEIASSREQERTSLAQHFTAADQSDLEIGTQLISQLRRSEYPSEQLAGFLAETERELPYWEICRLALRMLRGSMDPEETVSAIRYLPRVKHDHAESIQKVCSRIQERYAENITLAGMAAEVFLQPNYLSTLFRKETGMVFVQYLNRIRVEQGCRLLLTQPGLTMSAIAPRCGFPSERYFFSTFKKFTGVTPGDFQEELTELGINHASRA